MPNVPPPGATVPRSFTIAIPTAALGSLLAPRLFLELVVHGHLLQVVRFKNLVAIDAADIIDPIAAHQKLRAVMFAAGHKTEYPYSMERRKLVKPPFFAKPGDSGTMGVTMSLQSEFLEFSVAKLEELLGRIETCAARLTPDQIWVRGSDHQNAVGNLLLHLNGNVRQWILSGLGGAPDRRERDVEFATREQLAPAELTAQLRASVEAAVGVIRGLSAEDLLLPTRIQGYEGTKLTAVYHVVEHFAGHAFQIFFLTKLLTGEDLGFYAHLSGAPRPAHQPRP